MCVYRADKEALETSLFDIQQQLLQFESRKEQLEVETHNLRLRLETSTGEALRTAPPNPQVDWSKFTVLWRNEWEGRSL